MIINSLKLKNFISHGNNTVEFPLGVSILVGPNGAGKSAVIDAILYALTGDRVRGDVIDDLIRERTDKMEVSLDFQLDGLNYKIHRNRVRGGAPNAKFRIDDKLIANSHTEVTNEILRLLQMDKDTIVNSIFIRQGEITQLIDADPSERKAIIGKLIGLDKVEKAYVNMKKLVNHFKEKVKNFDKVSTEIKIREERRLRVEKLIEGIEKEINSLKKSLKIAQKELEEAKKEVEFWEKKEEKHNEIKNEISGIKEKLKAKSDEIEKLNDRLKEAKEAKKEMETIEPKIQILDPLDKYVDTLDTKNQLEQEIKPMEKELKRVKKLLSEKEENKENYELYKQKEEKIKEQRKSLQELEDAKSNYVKLEAEIKHSQEDYNKTQEYIDQIKEKAKKILPEVSLSVQEKQINLLEEKTKDLDFESSKLQTEIGKIDGRIQEIKEYEQILGEKETCPICHKNLTEEHRLEVIEEFQSEFKSILKQRDNNKQQIDKFQVEKNNLNKKLEKIKNLDLHQLKQFESNLKDLTLKIEKLKSEQKEKEQIVEKFEELKKNVKQLEETLEELKENYEKYITADRGLEKEREISQIKSDKKNLQNKLKEIDVKLKNLGEKLRKIPKKPKEELKKFRELSKKYEVLKSKSDEIEEIIEKVKNVEKEITTIESSKATLMKNLEELGFEKKTFKRIQEEYSKIDKNISNISKSIELKTESINQNTEEKKGLDKLINDLEMELEKLQKLKEYIIFLEKIRSSFSKDGIQSFMRRKIAPIITESATEYLDYFNLDISDITLNHNFDISLYGRTGEISVKSISGGEKVAVAIALRLAIARVITGKISTIIMDEPTTHLDEERRRELVKIMRNFLKEKTSLPQMIIVTHHRELMDLGDTIYRVRKSDNISSIELVQFI